MSKQPQACCTCIERANAGLAEMGAMVKTAWILTGAGSTDERYSTRIALSAEKIDSRSRQRLPVLIAQFCPLCGTKYMADDGVTHPFGAEDGDQ